MLVNRKHGSIIIDEEGKIVSHSSILGDIFREEHRKQMEDDYYRRRNLPQPTMGRPYILEVTIAINQIMEQRLSEIPPIERYIGCVTHEMNNTMFHRSSRYSLMITLDNRLIALYWRTLEYTTISENIIDATPTFGGYMIVDSNYCLHRIGEGESMNLADNVVAIIDDNFFNIHNDDTHHSMLILTLHGRVMNVTVTQDRVIVIAIELEDKVKSIRRSLITLNNDQILHYQYFGSSSELAITTVKWSEVNPTNVVDVAILGMRSNTYARIVAIDSERRIWIRQELDESGKIGNRKTVSPDCEWKHVSAVPDSVESLQMIEIFDDNNKPHYTVLLSNGGIEAESQLIIDIELLNPDSVIFIGDIDLKTCKLGRVIQMIPTSAKNAMTAKNMTESEE